MNTNELEELVWKLKYNKESLKHSDYLMAAKLIEKYLKLLDQEQKIEKLT